MSGLHRPLLPLFCILLLYGAAQQELANGKRISAEAEYQVWSLKHAEEAYEWQHISTMVIFVVVILLMVAGVVFSWIQFRQGMHHPGQAIASTVSTIAQSTAASRGDAANDTLGVIEKSAVTEFSASPRESRLPPRRLA